MRRSVLTLLALSALGCRSESGPPRDSVNRQPPRASLPPAAESALAAGHARYNAQEFTAARDLWLAAVPAARDSALLAELYTWLGLAAWRLGDLDRARTWESRAIQIKAGIAAPYERWRPYNALGLIALQESLNDSAAVLFEKAGALASEDRDPAGVAKATGNAALAYSYLGDLVRARAGHRSMRLAGRNLSEAKLEANGLANEAMVDIWEGDAASAVSRLDTARRMYRTIRDAVGEANALGQLATAYELTGEFGSAFAALDSSLRITNSHGLAGNTIEILRLLGGVHSRVGDHRRAVSFFNDAERLTRTTGADADLASIKRGTAFASLRLRNLPRARLEAETALSLDRDAEEPLEEIDDLLLLAEIEEASGRRRESNERLMAAGARARVTRNAAAHATVILAMARKAEREGEPLRTLTLLRQVDTTDPRIGFEVQSSASALASRAFLKMGAVDSAVAAGSRAVSAVDKVRSRLISPAVRSTFVSDRSDVYSDYITALLRRGSTEEAFSVADRARSRALIENLGVVRGRPVGPGRADLAESERILRRIDALIEALARTAPPPSASRGRVVVDASQPLINSLAAARSEYERLQIRAAEGDAASTSVLNGSAVDIGQLRRSLEPDEAVLEYLLGADSLFAFVVTRGGLRVARTSIDSRVFAQRLRLLKELWGSPGDEWKIGLPVSRALHQNLIAPARDAGLLRGVRRIVIVPHGMLAQVPFAGLMDSRSGRFLIRDYDLGFAPSAAALVALRSRSQGAMRRAPNALFAPFGRELPGTTREVDAIAALSPSPVVRINRRATEDELRRRLASGGLVHLASHGVLNHFNPMFSRVELARGGPVPADDGRLEVHELLSMTVRSPLVFLSGCETGASEDWADGATRVTGDLTLSQAFLSAGAMNVASTLWRIDDDGAVEIARRFYLEARRVPVFDALSSAQRGVARLKLYENPYYWAGYVIMGGGGLIRPGEKTTLASVK